MNEKPPVSLRVLGESYRKTLVATKEPSKLILLDSCNALIEPRLLPVLASWVKSVNLEEMANTLGASVSWCGVFKREIIERETANEGNIPPTDREE